MKTVPSYLFETIILNFVESQEKLSDFIDINLINFWLYLKSAVYNDVNDPKGFQGNLNILTYSEKVSISSKSNETYTKGYEAYRIEMDEKNQAKAINKWIEIFGDKFPSYG